MCSDSLMCVQYTLISPHVERGERRKKNFWVNERIKVTSMQSFEHLTNTSKWMGIRLLDHLMNIHQNEIFIINHYEEYS